jgi:MoxR-like ATPase
MAEHQVTIGDESHKTAEPFFVIATENPVESEGTFPLPAAELDRFMMRLSLGYPDRSAEIAILDDNPGGTILQTLSSVLSSNDFLAIQQDAAAIYCHRALKEAIVDIVRLSRSHPAVLLGASPRAGLQFLAASRALACVQKRDYVTDDDILSLSVPVLAHRLKLRGETKAESKNEAGRIVSELASERLAAVKTL